MAKLIQSTLDVNSFNLNGLDYKKDSWEIYYTNKEVSQGVLDKSKIKVGLRNKYKKSENLLTPIPIGSWITSGDIPYTSFDTLVGDLLSIINFSSGTSSGLSQVVNNYGDLVSGTQEGDIAYVLTSSGSPWSTLGADPYRPEGIYVWLGAEWRSSVTDIVNIIEDIISNQSSPVVETNIYRSTTDNSIALNEDQEGVLTFQTYSTSEPIVGLSSFDGTTLTISSSTKPVVVEANLIITGDIEFEGVFNIEEVTPTSVTRPFSEGVYGINSASRPASITIEPNTTVILNVTTSRSSYNNRLRTNSYIQIKEI